MRERRLPHRHWYKRILLWFSQPPVSMGGKKRRESQPGTLRQPPSERWYVSQLETISGGDHYRLQQYYWDCSKAAKEVTTSKTLSMFNGGFVGFNCRSTCKRPEDHCFSANGSFISPNGWWVDYMQQMGDALAQRPCGETVLDPDMLEATLLQIRCQNCCSNSKLVPEMRKFNKQLAEVERVVSKVSAELSGVARSEIYPCMKMLKIKHAQVTLKVRI